MSNRFDIYYWKCDRPSAFKSHNCSIDLIQVNDLIGNVLDLNNLSLRPFSSQGNHLTYIVQANNEHFFLRIENGPEGDKYMDIEAKALGDIKAIGVPVPHVFAVDASRSKYPFSYQLLEFVNFKDLNTLYKTREFAIDDLAHDIGHYIALWQEIKPLRFGLFDPVYLYNEKRLKGFHNSYPQYFLMNFDNHLDFLLQSNFLEKKLVDEIYALVEEHKALLDLKHGVMVHKDLAFWNILGTQSKIHSFIDWDDVISGDPTDDISLLACFHKGSFIREVIRGYKSVRPLPIDFELRFWLHLLRNMIVKAVIRVGGGYFEREDDLFLIGKGQSGEMLKIFTRERITMACLGLKNKVKIADL